MVTEFDELVRMLKATLVFLPDKPEETAESAARALWLTAAGQPCSVEAAQTQLLPVLDANGHTCLQDIVARRVAGVPLAHLTQRQSFMGLELLAGPDALIPRKETEIVGRAALSKLQGLVATRGGPIRVIDVCTGSGNLAIALAVREPQSQVIGIDLSPQAVNLAKRNSALHNVTSRVSFMQGDLFAPLHAEEFVRSFDMIVCNPPYISSAKVDGLPAETGAHEPRLAFDGGNFGVAILSRLIKEASRLLKPGSWLCFEVGLGQGSYFFRTLGKMTEYSGVETFTDSQGEIRAIAAVTT